MLYSEIGDKLFTKLIEWENGDVTRFGGTKRKIEGFC